MMNDKICDKINFSYRWLNEWARFLCVFETSLGPPGKDPIDWRLPLVDEWMVCALAF